MKRGFTFIELLIVITLIAILTASAYPQFVKYKLRSYNASALSDLKGVYASEIAFYTDWQEFVAISVNDISESGHIYKVVTLLNGKQAIFDFNPLSAHVLASSKVDASRASLVLVTKNTKGTKFFGRDTDVDEIRARRGTMGAPLEDDDVPNATLNQDDLAGWDDL